MAVVPSRARESGSNFADEEFVRVSGDGRSVELSLVIDDPEVAAFAASGRLGDNQVEGAKRVFRLGVVVSTTERVETSLAELRRAEAQLATLRSLPQEIGERTEAVLTTQLERLVGEDGRPGELARAIQDAARESGAEVRKGLVPIVEQLRGGGPDALPQVLSQRLEHLMGGATERLLARLLEPEGPFAARLGQHVQAVADLRSEIEKVRSEITSEVGRIVLQLEVGKAQAPAPVQAGRDWEIDALNDVARLTSSLGDSLAFTGATTGHARQRAGDAVLELNSDDVAGLRVALECRTGTKRMPCELLGKAMENREAHAALLLTERAEALPKDAEVLGFRIYPHRRMVVLRHDREAPGADLVLATAVQVARMLARTATRSVGRQAELAAIHGIVQHIETAIGQLSSLKSSMTGMEREAEKMRACVRQIEVGLRRTLGELEGLAAAA